MLVLRPCGSPTETSLQMWVQLRHSVYSSLAYRLTGNLLVRPLWHTHAQFAEQGAVHAADDLRLQAPPTWHIRQPVAQGVPWCCTSSLFTKIHSLSGWRSHRLHLYHIFHTTVGGKSV